MSHKIVILASASPRRQAMSACWGISVQQQPADIDETAYVDELPEAFVQRMAYEKAVASTEIIKENKKGDLRDCYWIAGDTIVVCEQQILGKATDKQDAKKMLKLLSNRTHQVMSAWVIYDGKTVLCQGVDCTEITFHSLSDEQITHYLEDPEYSDKAGAYGIQGKAGQFVKEIQGSFDNVIGMPLATLTHHLIKLNILIPPYPHLLLQSVQLQEKIKHATWRSGRPLGTAKLLAVSKRNDFEMIQAAMLHQLTNFGESYVQEWKQKAQAFNALKSIDSSKQLTWHFIGRIQTNKAKILARHVHWVHGLSRFSEAQALSTACETSIQQGIRTTKIKALIQVNLSGEESKNGIMPDQVSHLVEQCSTLPGIEIKGLMTFPPLGSAEDSRPYFKRLRQMGVDLGLQELSMGTSHDFEVAIEEGATWVRLGQALFSSQSSSSLKNSLA